MLLRARPPHAPDDGPRPIVHDAAVAIPPRPDLAGSRLRVPGRWAVYLVDPGGYRRWVPSDFVYQRLFGNDLEVAGSGEIERIALGPPLASGTMLIRGHETDSVYLVDMGRRRRVADGTVMRKYGFARDTVLAARQILVDSIPLGVEWE